MSIIRISKKLNMLLTRHQRKRVLELFVLMFIGGLMETCSVGLIIPFMDAVVNIDTIMDKWYVQIVCRLLGLQYPFTFLFVVSASIGLLFIVKNAFLIFEYNIQYRFSYNNMLSNQSRILRTVVNRPYEFFLSANSGELVRLINVEVNTTCQQMMNILNLLSELTVSFMLIFSILIITPIISMIIAGILLLLLLFINAVIKPAMRRAGREASAAGAEANKWLLQATNGIKEIKMMNREDFFCNEFYKQGKRLIDSSRKSTVLSTAPRYLIEAVCMSVMFFVIAVLIITGSRFNEIMPLLSAVAIAAIRLLPALNRISGTLANISYSEPMVDNVLRNIDLIQDEPAEDATGSTAGEAEAVSDGGKVKLESRISFSNITYHYPNSEENVLSSASFEIHRGESVGIVGSSGAGKTTAIDIILGLINPQEGQILVDGVDISSDIKAWHRQIGYIPQSIFMMDGSIRENIAFGRDCEDDRVWEALERAALADFVGSLPKGLDTQIGERGIRLSGGQRQRIGIARALYSKPEVLVFDEATSALDNETETEVMEAIDSLKGKKTMIIIAHRLTTIENCDHVYRVEGGKITEER